MMLGILGGMGPLAGAQFLVRLTLLTDAARDQEHIPTMLWSDPTVPDRTAARLAGGEDPLPALLRGLRALHAAGCGAVAMPCNTAHGWYDAMAAASPLPILHIVDAAAVELALAGYAPGAVVGVLGTAGTLAMRLYQDRLEACGYTVLVPGDAAMARQVTPAIARIKASDIAAARAPLAQAAAGLAARGATAVVMGCTEIPLALQGEAAPGVRLVDSIDALARAAIRWTGRVPQPLPPRR